MQLLLMSLKWIFKLAGATRIADPLNGWTTFVGYVLVALLIFLALRWFRNHVMWSVRNRLIVTYLFIFALPVTLAVGMAIEGGQFAVKYLAHFLAVFEIRAQSQRLAAANIVAADEIENRRRNSQQIAAA